MLPIDPYCHTRMLTIDPWPRGCYLWTPADHNDATYRPLLPTRMIPTYPAGQQHCYYRPLLAQRDATYRPLLAHRDATYRPLLAHMDATNRSLLAQKDATYRPLARKGANYSPRWLTRMLTIDPCCHTRILPMDPWATILLPIDPCCPQGC